MEQEQISIDRNLLDALAKSIKREKDLAVLNKQLLKLKVERGMDAALDEHLGYQKHAIEGKKTGNSGNGYSPNRLKGDFGQVAINTPRDRNSTFEPRIMRKGQTRFTEFDEQILALYARGMTTRDIADTFKEIYTTEVSHSLISKVTEAVIQEITVWQNVHWNNIITFFDYPNEIRKIIYTTNPKRYGLIKPYLPHSVLYNYCYYAC